MAHNNFFLGLLRRREVVLPSLRGYAVLLCFLLGLGFVFIKGIHPFLATDDPIGGELLVVEGWIPDYCWREALTTFRSGGYRLMVVTGGPLPPGMPYSSFGTHAELAATTLKLWGLGSDSIVAVPSYDAIRDRTYAEGVALREWIKSSHKSVTSIDLFTFSGHGRRSRYLYQKALGSSIRVGVFSRRDMGYDPEQWWHYSNGVRRVIDETVAYVYSVTLFRP